MTRRTPSVLRVLGLIMLIDMGTRVAGLRRTLRWTQRFARVRAGSGSGDVAACAHAVATAAAFYPRRALCLEQSLALYILLRRRSIAAERRLGVQPRPFYAHAWVEVDGAPVNETLDLAQTFIAFSPVEV